MKALLLMVGLYASAAFAAPFTAHVATDVGAQQWSYTIYNDSGIAENIWIANFTLLVGTSVVVVGVPSGWDYLTDGVTYVTWFNADVDPPYSNDIAPGAALGGFVISSTSAQSLLSAADIGTWDHTLDQPEQTFSSFVLSPVSDVPEPSTALCVSIILIVIAFFRSRQQVGCASR